MRTSLTAEEMNDMTKDNLIMYALELQKKSYQWQRRYFAVSSKLRRKKRFKENDCSNSGAEIKIKILQESEIHKKTNQLQD